MQTRQIVFTRPNCAELLVTEGEMGPRDVVVQTAVSTISCGTERANITGNPNVSPSRPSEVVFPRTTGYGSAGRVVKKGEAVTSVEVGDRVSLIWGAHRDYNIMPEENVVKITDDRISYEEAAMCFITTFPMAAIRKTRLEMGESVLVMGLGLLGQLAVRLARAAGGAPIIAADPIDARRAQAIAGGADVALNPLEEGFAERVKEATGGGVRTAIEVTGVGAGLNETLDCMARFGRVALLGCTRSSDFTVDYYKKVHGPGISLIGAHTNARPEAESSPGYFTHRDDVRAVMTLCAGGRISLRDMIAETHSPAECASVYTRLVEDRNFPTVVQFDWRRLEKDKGRNVQ